MIRRGFLKQLAERIGLAGFQYHQGESLWPDLTVGDRLELRREAGKTQDDNAIRVDGNGRKLGYLPCAQNQTTAPMFDNRVALEARIGGLERHANPWQRAAVEVWMVG